MSRLPIEGLRIPGDTVVARETERRIRETNQQLNAASEGRIVGAYNAQTAPPTGTVQPYVVGDFIRNLTPSGAQPIFGWICTVSGAPGTWVPLATAAGLPVFDFGSYTPILTNEANVVASTATPFYFLRVGGVVSGGGRVTIAPAAASTQSFLQLSLPIPSDFANAGDCSGTGAAHLSASLCGGIQAEPTANTARLSWVTTADVANRGWSLHFIYRIF